MNARPMTASMKVKKTTIGTVFERPSSKTVVEAEGCLTSVSRTR